MRSRLVPRLWFNHPNFFIVYFVCACVLHLGLGITQLTDKERYANPAFVHLYEIMPLTAWAFASLLVWLFMTMGAYFRFSVLGRLGLGLGFFLCLSRGLLIELGPGSGGGLFVWVPLAAMHFSQLSEPPINPLTAEKGG